MCTPWTIRDWATCFSACKFPVENEEPDTTTFCYSSAQVPNGAMGFTRRRSSNDNKSHGINKTGLHENKSDQERESTESTDEDYIVFCFREDGAIHVVKDGETEASDQIDRVNQSSTRHVNHRKVCSSSHDSMLNEDEATTSEIDSIICNKKGKEKWSINLDTAPPTAALSGKNHIEEIKVCETLTANSSDSNQSDSSSGSFAFPVLSWEGMESPAQMPKPDALQLRKHHQKAVRAALLQCCRF
ncbi:protein BREAKING OF ASYMMETRY IN THE STOMATAL LINEAGE isoform X1 [Rhododendron vialii]|uniref:protein BREAKING OF ASYMMETRY IN THE STOMATAL LINEAGE isoform X1 n=1 Tax=Rhododendron vialii TaxID=182163 RepID=UPI00265F7AE8|nr:protein BREAKING OF ASYMMETRY IN THE STOMATAL LINEAGE isoform X1 [Rhododendron vialii]